MTEQQMIADGWRRCAVGQRTTQQCGLVHEARAQERARIVALIHEQIAHWESEPVLRHWEDSADECDEVTALKRLLRQVKDTSHE